MDWWADETPESERVCPFREKSCCDVTFDSYRHMLEHCRQQHPDKLPSGGDSTTESVIMDNQMRVLSWEGVDRMLDHPAFRHRWKGAVLPEADWATPVVLQSWTFEPWVAGPIGLAAAIYVCGWLGLRRRAPQRLGAGRLAAFMGGPAAILVALESPLHPMAERLLQAHMVQHLLLLMVAPPLIWLGTPLLPLLRGLPGRTLRIWAGRLLARPALVRLGQGLAHPVVAWVAFVGSTWAWHTPGLYERALAAESWHYAQHACFLATGLAFWWPVVRPWPSRAAAPRGAIVLYLVLADLQNTVLSAWLVFAERVLYPSYATNPRPWGMAGLDDQAAAGAIM